MKKLLIIFLLLRCTIALAAIDERKGDVIKLTLF